MKVRFQLLCVGVVFAGQIPQTLSQTRSLPSAQVPGIRTQTSLVVVPVLVRDKRGKLIFTLKADDFAVKDDGALQKVTLEPDAGGEPLALVVVVEVGGAGAREFEKLGPLAPMLDSMIGNVRHSVAVVAFDSQPHLAQDFTPSTELAANAIGELMQDCAEGAADCRPDRSTDDAEKADNGAAILDSVSYAINMLRTEPPGFRRAILLVSESLDRGSKTTIEQAVRLVNDENVTIFSIGFSTAKSEAAHYAYRELPIRRGGELANAYPNPPHGCMGKEKDSDPDLTQNKLARFYDCLVQLAPPLGLAKMAAIAASDSMHGNVPETVAHLTGGEYFRLTNSKSLERDLMAISNHLPNRYVLSFHPKAPHPGLHVLSVHVPKYPDLEVTARTSYWVGK